MSEKEEEKGGGDFSALPVPSLAIHPYSGDKGFFGGRAKFANTRHISSCVFARLKRHTWSTEGEKRASF